MVLAGLRLLFCSCTLALACGAPKQATEPQGIECAEPAGLPAHTIENNPSAISARFVLGKRRLQHELARKVPVVLAQEKGRSIGAPGRLSYSIRRGALRFSAKNDLLTVSTRLSGDISVCKPLGPICAGYGKCRPTWRARVTVPLDWREPLRANTQVHLVRGCVLSPVGYDATEEVRRITRKEARKVAARINRELRKGQELALRGIAQLAEPMQMSDSDDEPTAHCIRFDAQSLAYSLGETTAIEDEALTGIIRIQGRATHECTPPKQLPTPEYHREIEQQPTLGRTQAALEFSAIEDQLSTAAEERVLLRSVGANNGENLLFVGVPQTGDCDLAWLRAEPVLNASGLQLRSDDGGPAAAWLSRQLVEKPQEFLILERFARRFASARADAETLLKQNGVELEFPDGVRSSVRVGQNSLSLVVAVRGTATLTAL